MQESKAMTIMGTQVETFIPLHGSIAPPLDASYYKGCGERCGVEREIIAVRTVYEPRNNSSEQAVLHDEN